MSYFELVSQIADRLAVMIGGISSLTDLQLSLYTAHEKFQPIHHEVMERWDHILLDHTGTPEDRLTALLADVDARLAAIHTPSFDCHERVLFLLAMIRGIDLRLCYEPPGLEAEGGRISFSPLLRLKTDEPVVVEALNRNGEDVNIWLHPKFPVSSALPQHGRSGRPLAARNAMHGLNGTLCNVLYYRQAGELGGRSPVVHSVILQERGARTADGAVPPERTRILFSPLSDAGRLLDFYTIPSDQLPYRIDQIPYQGLFIRGITDCAAIEARYEADFLAACRYEPDIFFAPEMLATDRMAAVRNHASPFLKGLIKSAARSRQRAPRLTVLPTHWRDGSNRVLLFSETGVFLGSQYKWTPFVNEKEGLVEALDLSAASPDVLLIHMVNQQRIALVICAEFLANPAYVQDFLCGHLGATLLLIPSYSRGEQDFLARLPSLKPYGTTVIWGNCCGAVQPSGSGSEPAAPSPRIIGACSYAGMDAVDRFGSHALCGFRCLQQQYCFFVVDVPTRIALEKPDSPAAPAIRHVCSCLCPQM